MTHPDARIYIAGHRGLVGSAIVHRLQAEGCTKLLLRTHAELDLTDSRASREFFEQVRPEHVFLAAARVGGSWPTTAIRPTSSTTTWPSRAA